MLFLCRKHHTELSYPFLSSAKVAVWVNIKVNYSWSFEGNCNAHVVLGENVFDKNRKSKQKETN